MTLLTESTDYKYFSEVLHVLALCFDWTVSIKGHVCLHECWVYFLPSFILKLGPIASRTIILAFGPPSNAQRK